MPPSLKPGDRIAIISPASIVKEEYVAGAAVTLKDRGYLPIIMPHAVGHGKGSYSASLEGRLKDLQDAISDTSVKAILCARGGYGCVHLLPFLSSAIIRENPKWIIGFSDVSARLACWYMNGLGSVHGPMAKHLTNMPQDDPCTNSLFNILENEGHFDYQFPASQHNNQGNTSGRLRGGNMAVLNGLASTPYDIIDVGKEEDDVILFLEDISEPIYAIERMLWRLYLSGTMSRVKGMIFGQFTEYQPDKNFDKMEGMIKDWLQKINSPDIPVVFDFPVGHADCNYPLTVGAKVNLEVAADSVRLHTVKE